MTVATTGVQVRGIGLRVRGCVFSTRERRGKRLSCAMRERMRIQIKR